MAQVSQAEPVFPSELPAAGQPVVPVQQAAQISPPASASFAGRLRALLLEKNAFMGTPDEEHVHFEFLNKGDMELLEKDPSSLIKTIEFNKQTKRFKAMVALHVPQSRDILIQGRFDEFVTVPVPNLRLKPGDIIRQSDLYLQKIPVTLLRHDTVRDQEIVIGKTSKHALMANKPMSHADIVLPTAIKKNDVVTLIYQKGGLTLQEKGAMALQSSALGETIKIKKQNNHVLYGVVENSQLVRIPVR